MLFSPQMLGLVEALLGPEACLFNDQVTENLMQTFARFSSNTRHAGYWMRHSIVME